MIQAVKILITAMRPSQWAKNLVLFAGLIFAAHFFYIKDFILSLTGFFIFCILSSSVYIINDLLDVEKDRFHPTKCMRPIASGRLSRTGAIIFSIILVIISLTTAFFADLNFFFVASSFFILNFLYSLILKKMPIVDVMVLSLSFVFRALAGVIIIKVEISPWLIVCTFLLALFMAIGKRRGEIILLEQGSSNHREVLSSYSTGLLDQMISVVTSSIFIAYSLYTFTSGRSVMLMVTIPFVLYGIFRYLYLVYQEHRGDNPTAIFISDRPLQITLFFWLILVFIILYSKSIEGLFYKNLVMNVF